MCWWARPHPLHIPVAKVDMEEPLKEFIGQQSDTKLRGRPKDAGWGREGEKEEGRRERGGKEKEEGGREGDKERGGREKKEGGREGEGR